MSYKELTPFNQRSAEAKRMRERYPDRVPIIVEVSSKADLPPLDKNKYLVPNDLSMGQFIFVIRKRIKLTPEKALFVMMGNGSVLAPTAALMGSVYNQHASSDGFLYCSAMGENTFGN